VSDDRVFPRFIAAIVNPWTDYAERADGTAYGSVPIWTTSESPSDLSAEFEIAADGTAELTDLHVL
jgi:hypothetical protein